MLGGRSALTAVVVAGLLVGILAPPAGTVVVVSPSPLQRYREAHVALAGGEYDRARTLLDELPQGFLLGDYAAFFAAEATLRGGEEMLALARFRTFVERYPDSVLVPPAMLAIADTVFRQGSWAEAEREARRFLARFPSHPEAGRILVRLAEARAAQGQVAEAVADLRRRWLEAPASGWGEAAREIMEDLARGAGFLVAPLGIEEQFLLAQRLAEAGEQSAAARTLEALLAQGPGPSVRHRALARLAPVLSRLARAQEVIGRIEVAVEEPASESRAALLYELGRLYQRAGQAASAASAFERLLREHPQASVAPDAGLQLARVRADLGRGDAAREAFQALVAAHPDSAAAASARWELAWLEYRAGRFRDAALAFRQLSTAVGTARLAGLYWSARALDQLNEHAAAAALYREVLSRGPHGYYGILAARRVRGQLPAPIAGPVKLAPDPIGLLRGEVRYQKAQALSTLGFDGFALARARDPRPRRGRGRGSGVGARRCLRRPRRGRSEPPLPPPGLRRGR